MFQEVLVVEPRSVLDNVWMGTDGLFAHRRSGRRATAARASRSLEALLGAAPPLDMPVEALSLSDRQACCLARALVRDPKILILDEATSALDVATRDRLFALVRERVTAGAAVVFISHRMDEIAEIGDRCTVMRSRRDGGDARAPQRERRGARAADDRRRAPDRGGRRPDAPRGRARSRSRSPG